MDRTDITGSALAAGGVPGGVAGRDGGRRPDGSQPTDEPTGVA